MGLPTTDQLLLTTRYILYEKAKGNLRAILQTYWAGDHELEYERVSELIKEFIDNMDERLG